MSNLYLEESGPLGVDGSPESSESAASWGAILAGAAASAGLTFLLLFLGAGLKLVTSSPWTDSAGSAFSNAGGVWLALTGLIASAIGGYLAGRLRTKWTGLHSDEVFFRDTAHGFLSWAAGSVIACAILALAASGVWSAASRSATGYGAGGPAAYYADALLRSDRLPPRADPLDLAQRGEVQRLLTYAARKGQVLQPDRLYLDQLVAARTGLSASDSDKRVADVIARAKDDLDNARRAGARLAIWTAVGMLVGAFSASLCALLGGEQRDNREGVSAAVLPMFRRRPMRSVS